MKRSAFVRDLEADGCVLWRHGARHIHKYLGLKES
jgi:hypothetical protein